MSDIHEVNNNNHNNNHKKELEKQLWNIANALRGNMSADEFRDYILGFIFYKYLSEKLNNYANKLLDGEFRFTELDENNAEYAPYFEAIKTETINKLGYFLTPQELFGSLADRGENV